MDNKAMFKLTYGLFVITAKEGEKDNGCIVNTVSQVTSSPNRISVAINKQNYTHDMIMATGIFNVSILTEKSTFATYKNFGFQSGRHVDKFEQISYVRAENGVVYIPEETNAVICANVVEKVDLGTHTLFIADVTDAIVLSEENSVTYDYYHKNIKEKPNKDENIKKGWVCTICGYIYEGEELPADFICPLCKHGAQDFKRIE